MARHNDTGRWGEDAAVDFLIAKGYAIHARNWRMHHLEIDIVAMKDDRVIFVEVKTRRSEDVDPVDAIDGRKVRHMAAAANAFMNTTNLPLDPQFDIIAVCGTPENHTIEHLPDAFFPPLKTY